MFSRGSSTNAKHSATSVNNISGASNPPSTSSSSSSSSSAHPLSLCADCGASGPSWASINRGVLLCADCTSVHRSLGRHISHVKSLRGGHWIQEQLTMVQSLYSCGANSIWEYSLLNPSSSKGSRKKPTASDPLHPTKSDFIRSKYQQLSFVYKPAKDEPAVTQSELSRQLHSSVRTPNLETSLRLISQGADPNYYHPEKNSTPLQVAARAGQACQVELLLVYGADPGAVDKMGRTAAEYAKQAGHGGLANRVNYSQYEVSDRFSQFLCGKKPDHSVGQHFIVPDMDRERNSEERKVAKRKMQGLNNSVFEELAMDVYDEIDRRETEVIWASVEPSSKSSVIIPFLPVNPEYGTTRNQGRQKLARLSAKEFSILAHDVLKEIRRRQTEMNNPWPKMPSPLRETAPGTMRGAAKLGQTKSMPVSRLMGVTGGGGSSQVMSTISDDEPIYDYVASDDDYYHIPDREETRKETRNHDSALPKRPHSATTSSVNSSPAKSLNTVNSGGLVTNEFKELKVQLDNSEQKVQRLIESNDDMKSEIARLSVTVSKLVSENENLKMSLSPTHNNSVNVSTSSLIRGGDGGLPYADGVQRNQSPLSRSTFHSGPTSMPSPGSNYMTLPSRYNPGRMVQAQPTSSHSQFYDPYHDLVPNENTFQQQQHSNSLPYTLPQSSAPPPPPAPTSTSSSSSNPSHHEYANPRELSHHSGSTDSSPLPSQEEVVRRTEAITRCIQELLISAKDEQFDAFIPCSERIVRAVTDMVILFPDEPQDTDVSASLSSLTAAATHFETECRMLIMRSQNEPLNQSFVTQQVIQCAFDIAKSTKQLVGLFQ